MIITKQGQKKTEQVIFFSMEDFVSKDHLLRKTESAVDFSYFYSIEGYLSPEAVFIDGTHIKADANIKKRINKNIPKAAKVYEKPLMEEINEDREERNKKPFGGGEKDNKETTVIVSNIRSRLLCFPQQLQKDFWK